MRATLAGLNFALAQSKAFVAMKIIEAPLIPKQSVSLGFGITCGLGAVSALHAPVIDFTGAQWTEAGLEVDAEIRNLSAKGSLRVSKPESEGEVHLHGGGLFRMGISTAVDEGHLVVRVVNMEAKRMDLAPSIGISCLHQDVWNSIPCGIIGALSGQVPKWLVDTFMFFFDSNIEQMLKAIIEYKLNANLAGIPTQFPLSFQNQRSPKCLELAFHMLGLSDAEDVKAASFQALAINTCDKKDRFPVPGLVPPGYVANSSMFSLAVSGSVPNSILFELHENLMLSHLILPSDLPADSALGLDTNSLALAFYCPWLSSKYAFRCPVWSPCGVEALIQTAGVPHVEMQEELRIHVPLSVDFRLQKDNKTSNFSEFLWRINLTAHAAFDTSIDGAGCQQLLTGHLASLEVSWIDVTKTQDNSWVATALSLNILMPLLLKPLEDMINSHLSRGVPLKTLPVGQSSYALSNSVVRFAVGKLILSTDVMLAEECPNKKNFVGRGHGHVVAT